MLRLKFPSAVSSMTGEGLDNLRTVMKDKASVFSGQSGVGKSSINAIVGTNLEIGDIVERTKKGTHTTTTTKLLPLDFGGWCIDTPGIKSFGVWDLKKEEIIDIFLRFMPTGPIAAIPIVPICMKRAVPWRRLWKRKFQR